MLIGKFSVQDRVIFFRFIDISFRIDSFDVGFFFLIKSHICLVSFVFWSYSTFYFRKELFFFVINRQQERVFLNDFLKKSFLWFLSKVGKFLLRKTIFLAASSIFGCVFTEEILVYLKDLFYGGSTIISSPAWSPFSGFSVENGRLGSFYSTVAGKVVFNNPQFVSDLNLSRKLYFRYFTDISVLEWTFNPNMRKEGIVRVTKDMLISLHSPQSVDYCSNVLKRWELMAEIKRNNLIKSNFPPYLEGFKGNNSLEKWLLLKRDDAFFSDSKFRE